MSPRDKINPIVVWAEPNGVYCAVETSGFCGNGVRISTNRGKNSQKNAYFLSTKLHHVGRAKTITLWRIIRRIISRALHLCNGGAVTWRLQGGSGSGARGLSWGKMLGTWTYLFKPTKTYSAPASVKLVVFTNHGGFSKWLSCFERTKIGKHDLFQCGFIKTITPKFHKNCKSHQKKTRQNSGEKSGLILSLTICIGSDWTPISVQKKTVAEDIYIYILAFVSINSHSLDCLGPSQVSTVEEDSLQRVLDSVTPTNSW